MRSFMKLAGSNEALVRDEMSLDQFMIQAEEYRQGGDAVDIVFKVLNLLGATHPFHVLRAAETRDWIQAGEYDRILRGEYRRRGDERAPYQEDLAAAARAYKEDASTLSKQFGDAIRDLREKMASGFARG